MSSPMQRKYIAWIYIGLSRSHVLSCKPKRESSRDENKWAPVCVLELILYMQAMELLDAFALYFETNTLPTIQTVSCKYTHIHRGVCGTVARNQWQRTAHGNGSLTHFHPHRCAVPFQNKSNKSSPFHCLLPFDGSSKHHCESGDACVD